jgi:hypothetical protein
MPLTTKAERIGEAIQTATTRARIYGDIRREAYTWEYRADAGEHCAHVAAWLNREAGKWGELARTARLALVTLTGAVV